MTLVSKMDKIVFLVCPNREQEKRKNILIQDKKAYYVSRFFTLLIENPNYRIIIPKIESVQKFWDFCCENSSINHNQAIWTSGKSYVIYDDYQEIFDELKKLIDDGYTIMPNSTNKDSLKFLKDVHSNNHLIESKNFMNKFKTKAWLHSSVDDENITFKSYAPLGLVCKNHDELMKAYQILKEDDVKYYIKPTNGTGGGGIVKVSNIDDIIKYKFTREVVLEKFMIVDRYEDGSPKTPSVQFKGTQIIDIIDQLVDGVSYTGSLYPAKLHTEIKEKCINMCQEILNEIKPTGFGGFDLIIVNDTPYLIDPNTCRFTGAYSAYMFWEKCRTNYFGFMSFVFTPKHDLNTLWEMMKDANLDYNKNIIKNVCIFPLVYLDDICQIIILANDYDLLFRYRDYILISY